MIKVAVYRFIFCIFVTHIIQAAPYREFVPKDLQARMYLPGWPYLVDEAYPYPHHHENVTFLYVNRRVGDLYRDIVNSRIDSTYPMLDELSRFLSVNKKTGDLYYESMYLRSRISRLDDHLSLQYFSYDADEDDKVCITPPGHFW